MAKALGTSWWPAASAPYSGWARQGQTVVNDANRLLNLTFSREDEPRPTLIGIRAGRTRGFLGLG